MLRSLRKSLYSRHNVHHVDVGVVCNSLPGIMARCLSEAIDSRHNANHVDVSVHRPFSSGRTGTSYLLRQHTHVRRMFTIPISPCLSAAFIISLRLARAGTGGVRMARAAARARAAFAATASSPAPSAPRRRLLAVPSHEHADSHNASKRSLASASRCVARTLTRETSRSCIDASATVIAMRWSRFRAKHVHCKLC